MNKLNWKSTILDDENIMFSSRNDLCLSGKKCKKNHVLHNEKLSLPHYPSCVETILLYKA